jgi:osmotically-inducible protein OsmY
MPMQGQPYYQDSSAMQMRGQPYQNNQGQYSQRRSQYSSNMDQYNPGYQQNDNNQGYSNSTSYSSENPNAMMGQPSNMQNNQNPDREYRIEIRSNMPNGNSADTSRMYSSTSSTYNSNVSDPELSKKIKDKIGSGWFSKGYESVYFDVYNGNVMLKGSVETQEEKNKVQDAVRKIDGVKQIDNQINVAGKKTAYNYGQIASTESKMKEYSVKFPNDKAAMDSDRVLNEKIRDKLNGGWFSNGYTTIVLDTSNGVVTVSGIVDNYDDIQSITKDIEKFPGVQKINNRLTARNK